MNVVNVEVMSITKTEVFIIVLSELHKSFDNPTNRLKILFVFLLL